MHISRDMPFDESCPFYQHPSSPLASPIEDIYFLTFSNTPITQVLPLSTHPTVSSHTTVVDPTPSSLAASPPRSLPEASPLIPPHHLLYYTGHPRVVNSSDEPSPSTIVFFCWQLTASSLAYLWLSSSPASASLVPIYCYGYCAALPETTYGCM